MSRRWPDSSPKRAFDVIGACLGLALLGPVLAVLAVACRIVQGRPVLHRATRAGRGARPFTLLKLRTMSDARGADGALLADAERITRLGRVLRSTSLDELPQLWNVLRGDMSLVGPRPLPMAYLPRYTDEEAHRHDVRPGVTGWAQVNGRNALPWDERLALDVWYVRNATLLLDLKVLLRTVARVARRSGISEDGVATMSELRPERSDQIWQGNGA
jgi:lipopolysaccharide/colanic/teichoic acid biosynthesis glycosyltransferase